MTSISHTELAFFDLFHLDEIQEIQDAFAQAAGVASVIVDALGKPLTRPSNVSSEVSTLISGITEAEVFCIFCETLLWPSETDGPDTQLCTESGLWNAGTRIRVGGSHVATWIVGLVRDESADIDRMMEYADRFGIDRKSLAFAVEQMPKMSRGQFWKVAESVSIISRQIFRKADQARLARKIEFDEARAEERIRESNDRFLAIFDAVNDAIFIHEWPDGKLVDTNKRASELFDYSREELLGLSVADLSENKPPYDAYNALSLLRKARERGPQVTEWRVRSKSGDLLWVEVSLRFAKLCEKSYVIVSVRDIGDRKCAEAAILREQRFSDAVVDSVPGLLYLYDEQARLVRWNRQHTVLTGYSDEELAGMHLYDWYRDDPESIEKIRAATARVLSEGVGYVEAMLRTKSGEKIPFFFTAVRLEFDGKNYFTGIGIDISERRKAECALLDSEARYRSVIENIQDTFYRTDAGGALIMLSPSGARLLGYDTVEELLGTPMENLWKSSEAFQEYVQILSEQGVVLDLEATLLRRDGSEVIVEATSNIYNDEFGMMLGLEGILRDIGKRKHAEREADRERMFTDAVMESMPGLLYIYDSQGRMVRWNKSHQTMTGYSPEELLGRNMEDWFGGWEPDTTNMIANFRQTMVNGRSETEAHLITKDGRSIPCLFTGARHAIDGQEYLFGMGMDITERKKSEELLRQSEDKFSRLFQNSPDAILLADIDTGIISDVNETFVAMTGYAREEVVGSTTSNLRFYVDPALWNRLYSLLRRDRFLDNQELMVRTKEGHTLLCALSSHVIQIGEQNIVISVFHNVTELKKMQEMMIQTEKMISVGGIAAGIAHEINNPLGIIMQSAQMLEHRTKPDFPKNMAVAEKIGLDISLLDRYMRERNIFTYVKDIRDAANRAAEIIRHMLDFSRRSDSERRVCNVNDVIDRAIALAGSDYDLRKSFDFRRIQLVREYADGLPDITCIETEIEQVLLNLLRNAAQALEEGAVADPSITVRTRADGVIIVIEVEDNGPGIPPEVARRIFEPFFTTKPPGQGTGLGLSVSYFIITQTHGGSINVSSATGAGACFHIELPRIFSMPSEGVATA